MRFRVTVLAAAAAAGCGATGTSGDGDPETRPPARPAPAEPVRPEGGVLPLETRGPTFVAAVEGTMVITGVRVLDPLLDPAGATASFRLRNETRSDLPDFLVSVVFAYPGAGGGPSFRPRFETVECPLPAGGTRALRVTCTRRGAGTPTAFQVILGEPEIATAREGPDAPGTTYMGGRLECAGLGSELTAERPAAWVRLLDLPGPPLPPMEARLVLLRGGASVWEGPWIVVPDAEPAGGSGPAGRTISWRLPPGESLAGCSPILRVRERR